MAQSIKLNDNLYWDKSSLYAVGLNSGFIQIATGATKYAQLPTNFKGVCFTVPLTDGINAWGMYGLTAQGQSSPFRYCKTMISCSEITIIQGNPSTNPIGFKNTGSYDVYLVWIGTQPLSFT